MMNSLEGLNSKQIEAVETLDQNTMVFAGPGTGKTRVITRKIAYLFENELVPKYRKVLAITFTNKAANEMKNRIKKFKINQQQIHVGNFHKFCAYVLSSYGDYIGLNRQFTFAIRSQQLTLAKSVLKDLDFGVMNQYAFLDEISRLKNKSSHWNEFIENIPTRVNKFKRAVMEYHKRLRQANMIDFDDAILLTLTLFKSHPEILSLYHIAFPYILIDEMQDTNPIQLELIKILGQKAKHVMAVADDDQSIYKWRGALPSVISDYIQALNAKKNCFI